MGHKVESNNEQIKGSSKYHLDLTHPIDMMALRFRDQLASHEFPTLRKQNPLIYVMLRRNEQSIPATARLLELNKYMLATLALPYKAATAGEHNALLKTTSRSMIGAVLSYEGKADLEPVEEFYDHAVPYVDYELQGKYGEPQFSIFEQGVKPDGYSHWSELKKYARLLLPKPYLIDIPPQEPN
jgi:hypothetical protein